ncbi:MAG: hypothetical protein IJZ39_06970 [Oscillospiraceae bacterium]|nr:hypothetical protein [Oscillospiraceae bacterium]
MEIIIEGKKVKGGEHNRNWKEKLADGLRVTSEFIRDNKEMVVLLIPVASSVVTGTTKIVRGLINLGVAKNERKVTDRRCYDPSEGHYWNLRRALNNEEWLRVSRRQANGERLGDILADMKLLKR